MNKLSTLLSTISLLESESHGLSIYGSPIELTEQCKILANQVIRHATHHSNSEDIHEILSTESFTKTMQKFTTSELLTILTHCTNSQSDISLEQNLELLNTIFSHHPKHIENNNLLNTLLINHFNPISYRTHTPKPSFESFYEILKNNNDTHQAEQSILHIESRLNIKFPTLDEDRNSLIIHTISDSLPLSKIQFAINKSPYLENSLSNEVVKTCFNRNRIDVLDYIKLQRPEWLDKSEFLNPDKSSDLNYLFQHKYSYLLALHHREFPILAEWIATNMYVPESEPFDFDHLHELYPDEDINLDHLISAFEKARLKHFHCPTTQKTQISTTL